MQVQQIAKIGVENCAYSFDELYSFLIPHSLESSVAPGKRVLVPFGMGNAIRQGMVFSTESAPETHQRELKSIYSVLDDTPLLNREMLQLALQIRERTFCTYFTAAKSMLPGGMCLRTQRVYSLNPACGAPAAPEDPVQAQIVTALRHQKKPMIESRLLKLCGLNAAAALNALEKAGLIVKDTAAVSQVGELSVRMVRLTDTGRENTDPGKLTPKQNEVYSLLSEFDTAAVREICYYTGVTPAVIKALEKKGICELYDLPVSRVPETGDAEKQAEPPVLSEKQQAALDKLTAAYRKETGETALLFGVTGSGKTNVYLALIDQVLKDGKNVIVLVPEISLTAQTIALFRQRFGSGIAVMHSGLSLGERRDTFYRIRNGEANVVIGTRSAVFAPLENIGAIIVDEEQEHTYKSEMSPRYDARIVARSRCAYHKALLVLVSATPSVETYAKAVDGKYVLCELDRRYGSAVLPQVITVDMTDKKNVSRYRALCEPLAAAIEDNLKNRKQSILLVNRRGYNTFVACEACKNVITCPKCSISLTYHSANNRLMCHYCGYSEPFTDTCPKCGDRNIRYAGYGTQRVEQEVHSRFPQASVLRMDADTTGAKNAHEKALSAFAAGKYDIMIGTQMVAKGLDFPNVTLVGVVSADNEMYNDDFRSAERTFDLITQVTGRAGRRDSAGKAYIQTMAPDNEILAIAAKQDYKRFFRREIAMRRAMVYPPFCDICRIGVSAPSEALAFQAANEFFAELIRLNDASFSQRLIVLGPLPPKVAKVNNLYRQKLIVKCVNSAPLRELISLTLKTVTAKKELKNAIIYAAMNPETTD